MSTTITLWKNKAARPRLRNQGWLIFRAASTGCRAAGRCETPACGWVALLSASGSVMRVAIFLYFYFVDTASIWPTELPRWREMRCIDREP